MNTWLLASALYTAYAVKANWLSFDNHTLPPFHETRPDIQEKWLAVAEEAIRLLTY